MSDCTGDGSCLIIHSADEFESDPDCKHGCTPVSCPRCREIMPKYELVECEGYCDMCSNEVRDLYIGTGMEYTGEYTGAYKKFMEFMATLYSEYKFAEKSILSRIVLENFLNLHMINKPGNKLLVSDLRDKYYEWYYQEVNKTSHVYDMSVKDVHILIKKLSFDICVSYGPDDMEGEKGYIRDKAITYQPPTSDISESIGLHRVCLE